VALAALRFLPVVGFSVGIQSPWPGPGLLILWDSCYAVTESGAADFSGMKEWAQCYRSGDLVFQGLRKGVFQLLKDLDGFGDRNVLKRTLGRMETGCLR
jgi:hypothetical protein